MRADRRGAGLRALRNHPLVFLSLSFYALFNIACLIWLIGGSFKSSGEIMMSSPWAPPEKALWSNYADAWTIGNMGTYLMNSIIVTVVATALVLILGSLSGYILGKVRFPGVGVVKTIFLAAMIIPPFALVVPLFDVLSRASLLDTRTGLIIVYVAMEVPMTTFILTSFHETLPRELEESGAIDGASPFQTFRSIVLPLTSSAVIACAVVNVLHIWNEFIYALTFLSRDETYTLAVGIFKLSQLADYSSNWSILFAGMVMSILPILLFFILFQKSFSAGLSQGALKL